MNHTNAIGVKPTKKAKHRNLRVSFNFDMLFLITLITLIVFGLMMIYSSSPDFCITVLDQPPMYMFNRQLVFTVISAVAFLIATFFDYRLFKKEKIVIGLVVGISLFLIYVLFFGDRTQTGSARTVTSGGSIMPGEFAKLIVIIYLAAWLNAKRFVLERLDEGLLIVLMIVGFIGGLVYFQPDFSAFLTIVLMGGVMFFLAGANLKHVMMMLGGLGMGGAILLTLSSRRLQLMQDYVGSIFDATQANEHIKRAIGAFVTGGWFGNGLGVGNAKYTGLPLPPTDSIFAVVAQELGFVGATFLVVLYCILIWRGLKTALNAPDNFGRLLAGGITDWLAIEVFINMAVLLNILPFAGNALPFMSAGGTNLLVMTTAMGILMNISRQAHGVQPSSIERIFNEAINQRGGYRRRRVSRSRRTSNTAK
jgi:cell division protein FtsW